MSSYFVLCKFFKNLQNFHLSKCKSSCPGFLRPNSRWRLSMRSPMLQHAVRDSASPRHLEMFLKDKREENTSLTIVKVYRRHSPPVHFKTICSLTGSNPGDSRSWRPWRPLDHRSRGRDGSEFLKYILCYPCNYWGLLSRLTATLLAVVCLSLNSNTKIKVLELDVKKTGKRRKHWALKKY